MAPRSIRRSVAVARIYGRGRPVGNGGSAARCIALCNYFGGGGEPDRGRPERPPRHVVQEEKTMRRLILLTVLAALTAFAGACTPTSENKAPNTTPAASPSATSPITVSSPTTTASPAASPANGEKKDEKKDEKKSDVKVTPTSSPAGKSTTPPVNK